MKMKFLPFILLAIFLAAANATFAQPGKPSGHHHGNKEMQGEIKAYVQKNIVPVMQQQRLKLERKLSSADKKQIRELRNRMAANRQQTESFRQELQLKRQPGTRVLTEEQRTQMQKHRVEMRNIRTEAVALAHKYDATIQALFKEVAGPAETWRKDLRAIAQKYEANIAPPFNPNDAGGKKHEKRRVYRERGQVNYLRPVPFLLWDVNKPMLTEDAAPERGTRIFPNPVVTNATLAYTVETAGRVTIDLLDAQGKVIRNLRKTNQTAGNYHFDLDLDELNKGIYFLKITTPSGTETQRFLKN